MIGGKVDEHAAVRSRVTQLDFRRLDFLVMGFMVLFI
jgi:hypothetical protein